VGIAHLPGLAHTGLTELTARRSYGGAVITEAGTHENRELRQERKIPYPQAGATKERRKQ
jgi:hypothetical protein